jgi:hypothetical protein
VEGVSAAQIDIKGVWQFPMDKLKGNKFKLQLTMDKPWTYEISVVLTKDWNTKTYPKVAYVNVIEKVAIGNVKVETNIEKESVKLTWNYSWKPSSFEVVYWENKNNLGNSKIVKENQIILSGLDLNKTYYVQIYPLNDQWQRYGEPSSIITIQPGLKPAAPTCVVKNIKLKLKTINWKHYIVWDKVSGAKIYVVSSADKPDWPFAKLGETNDTKWEYPFDPKAEKAVYKYYKVEAVCEDWQAVQIDKVKKVQVWPADTILVLILMSLILYGLYRLYGFTRE